MAQVRRSNIPHNRCKGRSHLAHIEYQHADFRPPCFSNWYLYSFIYYSAAAAHNFNLKIVFFSSISLYIYSLSVLCIFFLDVTHMISDKTIRIKTKGSSKIALQFKHSRSLDVLIQSYEANGVVVNKDAVLNSSSGFDQFHDQRRGGFPNVNDPAGTSLILYMA
jgi:hypothetical protein